VGKGRRCAEFPSAIGARQPVTTRTPRKGNAQPKADCHSAAVNQAELQVCRFSLQVGVQFDGRCGVSRVSTTDRNPPNRRYSSIRQELTNCPL